MEKQRRIIKFRAKDNADNEWYYGDLLQAIDNDTTKRYFIITDNYSSKATNIELNMCQSPEVLPETIGQFTGLYDKNKVPIYEGDIVKKPEWMGCYDEEICLCIYNQENNTSPVIGFGLYTKSKLTGRYQDLVESDEWDECEVIGNIYDNPDLLGE